MHAYVGFIQSIFVLLSASNDPSDSESMDSESFLNFKALSKKDEFRDLSVEDAIRLIGEKEKALIIAEKEKIVQEFRLKLDDKNIRR